MKPISPSFQIDLDVNGEELLKRIERAGRTCYKSEERITEISARKFVGGIIKSGHESVIEHEKVTVRVICDRGVTHEIVRHRIGSYSQESTRYVDYEKRGMQVITPLFFDSHSPRLPLKIPMPLPSYKPFFEDGIPELGTVMDVNEFDLWWMGMCFSEWLYVTLIKVFRRSPQEARSVLPNSLKTEIVITYNLREWRHFFKLRTSKRAHPQMLEITIPMLAKFKELIPVVFDDISSGM